MGKVWTPSAIRELARKKFEESKKLKGLTSNQSEVDDLDSQTDSNSSENLPSKGKKHLYDAPELSGQLSYWSQYEESLGNRVILVVPSDDPSAAEEIWQLSSTLGLAVEETMFFRPRSPDQASYLGEGQVSKLKKALQEHSGSGVVIDAPLRPSQVKNLEKSLKVPVVDREGVILSIFRAHAQSKQAQLQVELAQLKYLQPRLAGLWMGLSRQGSGGAGGLHGKGLGETRLELDRRVVKDRIAFLSKKLKKIEAGFDVQSSRRSSLPRVALVGYTNAGKSTLMNQLTRAGVKVEDKLFATLDTTVRTFVPPTEPKILVSDTVGFVRDLPHNLVASFKTTLAEAIGSSLVLHVLDVSHPNVWEQFETTEKVLEEIGAAKTPRVLVLNKLDQLKTHLKIKEVQIQRWVKDIPEYKEKVSVSALNGQGLEKLREIIMSHSGAQYPEWMGR